MYILGQWKLVCEQSLELFKVGKTENYLKVHQEESVYPGGGGFCYLTIYYTDIRNMYLVEEYTVFID